MSILTQGLISLGLNTNLEDKLDRYIKLCLINNKKLNLLSSNTTYEHLVIRHVLDSIAVVPIIRSMCISSILDLGSGAGFPGICISIACPELEVAVLDSKTKKCDFMTMVGWELELKNLTCIRSLAQEYIPEPRYHALISRAYANFCGIVEDGRGIVAKDGYILAMKAKDYVNDRIPDDYYISRVEALQIPNLYEERYLIIIKLNI